MIISYDRGIAEFTLWLEKNSEAAAELPTKSVASDYPSACFVEKYQSEWTNEMLFAFLLTAGAQGNWNGVAKLIERLPAERRLWLNGGLDGVRIHCNAWGDSEFASTFEELSTSEVPYMLVHCVPASAGKSVYISLAKFNGAYSSFGVMSTGILKRVGRGEPKRALVWDDLCDECSYYRQSAGSIGTCFVKLMVFRFAKLYRISLKAKPKKEKPAVVTKAIAFHNDQVKLLAVADELAAKLRAFQRDVEAGNLNKTVVAELYSQFEELQRNTTETKKKHKRFVGETAEETRKLAEEGLTSTK